jgi:hypothetical protein
MLLGEILALRRQRRVDEARAVSSRSLGWISSIQTK